MGMPRCVWICAGNDAAASASRPANHRDIPQSDTIETAWFLRVVGQLNPVCQSLLIRKVTARENASVDRWIVTPRRTTPPEREDMIFTTSAPMADRV